MAQQNRRTTILLVCGVLASLLYAVTALVAAARWDDYSATSQTISELFALGAPSASLVVPLFLAHDLLVIAFAVGLWSAPPPRRALRVTAVLLSANGATGLVATAFFPIHLREVPGTLTDTMHAVLTAVIVLFILLAIGFAGAAFGGWFCGYSVATLVILVVFGALAGTQGPTLAANEPTPWLGVFERINIGGYLLWLAVLAVVLLRGGAQPRPDNAGRSALGVAHPTARR
jgi:hypothetical protein